MVLDVDRTGFMGKLVLESVVVIFMEGGILTINMEIGREGSIDGVIEESMMIDMDVAEISEEKDVVCIEILETTTRIFLKKGSVNSVK